MKDQITRGGYLEVVGRRKTSTARVRIFKTGKKENLINNKNPLEYFSMAERVAKAFSPLNISEDLKSFNVTVIVKGGGFSSQVDAIRHGISRAIVEYDKKYRGDLKELGYLTRDPRRKERKKFGLKKARKAPQWSKR